MQVGLLLVAFASGGAADRWRRWICTNSFYFYPRGFRFLRFGMVLDLGTLFVVVSVGLAIPVEPAYFIWSNDAA